MKRHNRSKGDQQMEHMNSLYYCPCSFDYFEFDDIKSKSSASFTAWVHEIMLSQLVDWKAGSDFVCVQFLELALRLSLQQHWAQEKLRNYILVGRVRAERKEERGLLSQLQCKVICFTFKPFTDMPYSVEVPTPFFTFGPWSCSSCVLESSLSQRVPRCLRFLLPLTCK